MSRDAEWRLQPRLAFDPAEPIVWRQVTMRTVGDRGWLMSFGDASGGERAGAAGRVPGREQHRAGGGCPGTAGSMRVANVPGHPWPRGCVWVTVGTKEVANVPRRAASRQWQMSQDGRHQGGGKCPGMGGIMRVAKVPGHPGIKVVANVPGRAASCGWRMSRDIPGRKDASRVTIGIKRMISCRHESLRRGADDSGPLLHTTNTEYPYLPDSTVRMPRESFD